MNDQRPRMVREAVAVVLVLVLLIAGAGLLVGNVVDRIRSLDAGQQEPFPGSGEIVAELERVLREQMAELARKIPAGAGFSPKKAVEKQPAAVLSESRVEVRQVRFFESGKGVPAPKDRNYGGSFGRQSRMIFTEISYKNNRYQSEDSEIPVTVRYFDASGQQVAEKSGVMKPKKEWSAGLYATGAGADNAGFWRPGQYKVQVTLDGKAVGDYGFRIE